MSPLAPKVSNFLVLFILAASLSLNVALGWRIRQEPRSTAKPVVVPGFVMPTLTVAGFAGSSVNLTWSESRPTVLYVFSPECRWCARNLPNLVALANSTTPSHSFIGLSVAESGVSDYVARAGMRFPVYLRLAPSVARRLGLVSTPQTIVIAPGGKVLQVWRGAYGGKLKEEIERYFGIQLPGLT